MTFMRTEQGFQVWEKFRFLSWVNLTFIRLLFFVFQVLIYWKEKDFKFGEKKISKGFKRYFWIKFISFNTQKLYARNFFFFKYCIIDEIWD